MSIAITALFTFSITLILLLTVGIYFARVVTWPKTFDVEETYRIEKEKRKLIEEEYLAWEQEAVIIQSPYGYPLHGQYFPISGSRRTVILSHGITYNLYGSVKYMPIFRELGFNILVYDLRFHGRSGGKYSTFGFYEKHDLRAVTDWVLEKTGADTLIGTHGESMGAAISLLHAALDPRISFVVSDSSFSDLFRLLAHRIRIDYHLPAFPVLHLASFMSRLMSGMSFHSVSPDLAAAGISAPVLFAHGGADTFIPVSMAHELYESKKNGPRSLYLAPGAEHAETFWSDPAPYTHAVHEFLRENNMV